MNLRKMRKLFSSCLCVCMGGVRVRVIVENEMKKRGRNPEKTLQRRAVREKRPTQFEISPLLDAFCGSECARVQEIVAKRPI